MDLQARLEASLSDQYDIERELGGGGMSRVFVATEKRLGRRVVIKVLSTELGASLSAGRFAREIQLAASLQQANIVPVLNAGDVDGTPFYTMPFVEGESLRGRLTRGPLAEYEAISILRDVARALVFAHERGIVHRDIKPDNVLLSGEAAVVTDFGIAKAINAARAETGGGLTQSGTSIGTPAYMAPEQAAGDPATDHRADLYSFGCLAFELLTGSPPFDGLAPHRLMLAHLSEPAPAIASRRTGVSRQLEALVIRCLAKSPDERPATAREVLRELEAAALYATGQASAGMARGRSWLLPHALGIWMASAVAAWILARAAVVGIGLPSWVVPLTLIVAALGLPAVLLTWFVDHSARRAALRTPGGSGPSTMQTLALRAAGHVSWARTWRAGALSAAAVVVAVAVVMVLRAFGLGPAASLLAAGRIDADSRLLVAEFNATVADTSLGSVMAQAMRTSLGQSNAVQLVGAADLADALRRMTLPTSTRLTEGVARDLAVREGIPLVVAGQVSALGSGFLVSARLISTDSTREALAEFQRAAEGPQQLLEAIDQLARDLRSRIGESLRSVQRAPALAQVTTSSLAALREFTRAVELGYRQADFVQAVVHLEAAIRADSTFAMAWRTLGAFRGNAGRPQSQWFEANRAAYRFRARLTGQERALVEASYLSATNRRAAIDAWRALGGPAGHNNLGKTLRDIGEYAAAETVLQAGIEGGAPGRTPTVLYFNLYIAQLGRGAAAEARSTVDRMRRLYPDAITDHELGDLYIAWADSGVDATAAIATRQTRSASIISRVFGANANTAMAGARGQLHHYEELSKTAGAVADSARSNRNVLPNAVDVIVASSIHRRDERRGVARLDSLMEANPVATLHLLDHPGLEVAIGYAQLGRADKAKPLIADFESRATREEKQLRWSAWQVARGEVAMTEQRFQDALAAFRLAAVPDSGFTESVMTGRNRVRIARAFDRLSMADSAIAHFESFTQRRSADGLFYSPLLLPVSLRRLGELYEAKGDFANAIRYFQEFVRLWQSADAELQPQVADIRSRVARLLQAEARRR